MQSPASISRSIIGSPLPRTRPPAPQQWLRHTGFWSTTSPRSKRLWTASLQRRWRGWPMAAIKPRASQWAKRPQRRSLMPAWVMVLKPTSPTLRDRDRAHGFPRQPHTLRRSGAVARPDAARSPCSRPADFPARRPRRPQLVKTGSGIITSPGSMAGPTALFAPLRKRRSGFFIPNIQGSSTRACSIHSPLRTISGVEDSARIMAILWTGYADAGIGCFNAKYKFGFWRPVTAIPVGGTSRRPACLDPPILPADPTWMPSGGATPSHPEYPAAHGCITASVSSSDCRLLRHHARYRRGG